MKKKNDFNYMLINNNSRVMVFNGRQVITRYSDLPKKLIENIAKDLELYLYGETCMYTGKYLYKVGKVIDEAGGVVNLYTTYSKADFNRFICKYVNTK